MPPKCTGSGHTGENQEGRLLFVIEAMKIDEILTLPRTASLSDVAAVPSPYDA